MGGGSQASVVKTKLIASASTNVNNDLIVWYTNSDQFLNKIDELKLRTYNADTKPSILSITEVNPKNNRKPIIMSELKIYNFLKPLYNPYGRGICIYLANIHDLISTSSTIYHSQATIALEDNDFHNGIGNKLTELEVVLERNKVKVAVLQESEVIT